MGREPAGRDETSGRTAGGRDRRPRRELLTGAAAAALGVITTETLTSATPAQAAQGSAVLLGQDNTAATARTGLFTAGGESALLADPSTLIGVAGNGGNGGTGVGVQGTGIIGVRGQGNGAGNGVVGNGGPNNGFGVVGAGNGGGAGVAGQGGANNGVGVGGTGGGSGSGVAGEGGASNGIGVFGLGRGVGDGVQGESSLGNGVHGISLAAGGVGVLAENSAGGTALKATGPTTFSRSGVLIVAAGSSTVTKTGVPLTAASLVLATLQQNVAGVWVRAAVPNVSGSSFTVYLSKAVSTRTKVGWFVVN